MNEQLTTSLTPQLTEIELGRSMQQHASLVTCREAYYTICSFACFLLCSETFQWYSFTCLWSHIPCATVTFAQLAEHPMSSKVSDKNMQPIDRAPTP